MNKKENQRTRLTKMLFKDGLIALLQKKQFTRYPLRNFARLLN